MRGNDRGIQWNGGDLSYEAHIASVGLTSLLCIQALKPMTLCHIIIPIYQLTQETPYPLITM